MTTIKTIGIVALALALVAFIGWMIKKQMTGTDVKTGVSNDKIKTAAESLGIPKPVAASIAAAPDSEAAARSIGVPPVLATAIANGIKITSDNLAFSPNDRRIIAVNNTAGHCPAGSFSAPLTDGTFGCISNAA